MTFWVAGIDDHWSLEMEGFCFTTLESPRLIFHKLRRVHFLMLWLKSSNIEPHALLSIVTTSICFTESKARVERVQTQMKLALAQSTNFIHLLLSFAFPFCIFYDSQDCNTLKLEHHAWLKLYVTVVKLIHSVLHLIYNHIYNH